MRTIERKLYHFEELSPEVRQKVIDKHYENEDYPLLTEDLKDYLKECDTLGIFSNIELYYSLSYCQGDGLSFVADIDFKKFLKENYSLKESVLNAILSNISVVFQNKYRSRYTYATKEDIYFEIDNIKANSRLFKLIVNIEKELNDYYYNICRRLEKYGYSILEYRMTEEEFKEFSNDNLYEYYENGELF